MATVLGCGKCGALFPVSNEAIAKHIWPHVCNKCSHAGGGFAWAGSPEWEKAQREECAAKQVSHSQPQRLDGWLLDKPQQERFFPGSL
jgi:hypothetical protein